MKSYAQKHLDEMFSLVINSAKMSSYLLLIIGIPVFVEIEFLLKIWLGEYPSYAPLFLRIILVQSWVKTLGEPTVRALHAIGNIKLLNIVVGVILLLILPITYFLLRFGYPPEIALGANIILWTVAIPIRLMLLRRYSGFPVMAYIKEVIVLGLVIATICFVVPYIVHVIYEYESWVQLLLVCFVSVITSGFVILFLGFSKNQRTQIMNKVKRALRI